MQNSLYGNRGVKLSSGAKLEKWLDDTSLRLVAYPTFNYRDISFVCNSSKNFTIAFATIIKQYSPELDVGLELQITGDSRNKRIPLVIFNKVTKEVFFVKVVINIQEIDKAVKIFNDFSFKLSSVESYLQNFILHKVIILLNEDGKDKYKRYLEVQGEENGIEITSYKKFLNDHIKS